MKGSKGSKGPKLTSDININLVHDAMILRYHINSNVYVPTKNTWKILLLLHNFEYRHFIISSTFIRNTRLKEAKNEANTKCTLRLNFCYLENIHILHIP